MKTTLDLPDELIREVKLRAVMQGRSLKDLVTDFLWQGLGMVPPARLELPPAGSMVEIGQSGLPIIRCRTDAPASRMSIEELRKFEQST